MVLMLGTALVALRLRIAPWRMVRTVVVAAGMTGVMALASPLGLFPAAIVGGLVYVGGLFALRVISLDELRALRETRAESA